MPAYGSAHSGNSPPKYSVSALFIQTSFGRTSRCEYPKSNVQSATFAPTPVIFISSFLAVSLSEVAISSVFIVPSVTFFAASIMYRARKPLLSGARSSGVRHASFWGAGNAKPPSTGSPNCSHSLPIMPFIRGILLFCDIIKEQSVSHLSCLKILIPLFLWAAALRYLIRIHR